VYNQEIITEDKNLHLEHIEDLVFLQGQQGAMSGLQYIKSVMNLLSQGKDTGGSVTVKWDGAPAIFVGTDPEDGQFFVGTKSVFTQNPKLVKSASDLDKFGYEGDLRNKIAIVLRELPKLGIQDVLQGDLMYIRSDLKMTTIDGEKSIVFQPNTITYAVPVDSELGKRIANSQMGIIFHTTYTGETMADMNASFGADVSKLNQVSSVWFDDATYKDLSGEASLRNDEKTKMNNALDIAEQSIQQADFTTVQQYAKLLQQYVNSRIKQDKPQVGDVNLFSNDLVRWYTEYRKKEISKLKNQDPESPAVKRRLDDIENFTNEINTNLDGIASALTVYNAIIVLKNLLINKLNKVDSIKTLLRTDTGYKVTNPEGFVAIGKEGGAVKLVDRLEFSKNNFNAVKNWSKG
tara:strand:+ start:997 stop:2211 length:1215 start_codon:yes stop_codon:yes gene_type:complete